MSMSKINQGNHPKAQTVLVQVRINNCISDNTLNILLLEETAMSSYLVYSIIVKLWCVLHHCNTKVSLPLGLKGDGNT